MSAPALRARPLGRLTTVARAHPLAVKVGGLVALMAVSAFLRTQALNASFWIDEAISVGIGSFPLLEIPGVLRMDGSPPLWYLLLHVWMQVFGTGEVATHVFSLSFSLLSIPAAYWAARSLFGARTGWVAAGLAALNPFLTFYAQETRMYSLAAVVGLLVTATFLHAFVRRDRRYVPVFAVLLAAMLYIHNWALFLGAATAVALAAAWRWTEDRDERRALVRDGAIAYGITGLLYLPWVPTLLHQAMHTGAPWADPPGLDTLLNAVWLVFGGTTAGIALLLVAGNGLVGLIRDERDRRAAILVVLAVSAVLIAWLTSQVSPVFANRYLAAFVGPLLLVAAVGLSHAGRLGVVCLVILAVLWFDPRTGQLESKSNVRAVAAMLQTYTTPGDLVVSTHPEALPLVSYYFPEGVRYADSLGAVTDPRLFDWTDATERLKDARPKATIDGLLSTLRPGQDLLLVQPVLRTYRWNAPWTSLVRRRVVQWERRLDHDPRVRREAVVPVFGYDRLPRGVRVVVYRVR